MTRMIERRIEPSDLSAPEVSGRQVELSEIDQNNASSLSLSIQEVSKEQTSTGIEPKTLSLQKETSSWKNIRLTHLRSRSNAKYAE
uniref:Uncharacterized protein n=1 Tax=Loa loa TaxID=7209 RepID=A0A1I7VW23_LOALO